MASRKAARGFNASFLLCALLLLLIAASLHYVHAPFFTRELLTRPIKQLSPRHHHDYAVLSTANQLSKNASIASTSLSYRPASWRVHHLRSDAHIAAEILHGIHKRVVYTLDDALERGQSFLDKLGGTREESRWTTVDQVEAAGWTVGDPDDDTSNYYSGASGPYDKLGIKVADGLVIRATQFEQFDNCRHKNIAQTGAEFQNTYNVPGRAIVGLNNYSPVFYRKQEDPKKAAAAGLPPWTERLPDVYQWSDVVWLIWASVAEIDKYEKSLDPGRLKYIFRHYIVTEATIDIINAVAPNPDQVDDPYNEFNPPFKTPWPGVTFRKGTREFQALLGTAHAGSIVYMITQHPDEMPGKDIESITMFTDKTENGVYHQNLLFTLTG